MGNHWDDRQKLKRDYEYLKGLHDSLLEYLAEALNHYHQTNKPLRYWQMILDPWLLTYVAVIFDRWECLRVAFEYRNRFVTIALEPAIEYKPAFDFGVFVDEVLGDVWNYQLFLEIIESTYSQQCEILQSSSSLSQNINEDVSTTFETKIKSQSLKRRVVVLADRMLSGLGRLFPPSRVVLFESYFPLMAYVKLSLKLRQLPRLYLKEFEWSIPLRNATKTDEEQTGRDGLQIRRKANNRFEAFLFRRIVRDIPYTYMEGFAELQLRASQVPMKPKVILTAMGHWYNELFKLWSAEQMIDGCKFITTIHGGGMNSSFNYAMDFEEDISDYHATPSLPYHQKHVQLPMTKLAGVNKKSKSKRNFCSMLGNEGSRYALRIQARPLSSQNLVAYRQMIDLYNELDSVVKNYFRVKPFTNQGFETRQRFIDDLGSEKVYAGADYYKFLSESRLVVCTYPQTSFAEAMCFGLPTILVFPRHLWELDPAKGALLKVLISAKIMFYDHQAAAAHINSIWVNPDEWWDSRDVVNARVQFHRQAIYLGNDWRSEWITFVKGVAV